MGAVHFGAPLCLSVGHVPDRQTGGYRSCETFSIQTRNSKGRSTASLQAPNRLFEEARGGARRHHANREATEGARTRAKHARVRTAVASTQEAHKVITTAAARCNPTQPGQTPRGALGARRHILREH